MTKERKDFILSIFRSYKANKQYLKFASTKRLEDMTAEEKAYIDDLKKKVDVVDYILNGEGYQDPNKKNFVVGHLINGQSQKRVSFGCYVSERSLWRWRVDIFNHADARLKTVGM